LVRLVLVLWECSACGVAEQKQNVLDPKMGVCGTDEELGTQEDRLARGSLCCLG